MDRVYRALSPDYPAALRELRAPPDPLYVRGDLPRARGVAIVGRRKCSSEAAAYARKLARRLAENGIAVFSGGAVGIDAAAHEGALDAGGVTVAVVATGLGECYPPEHASLYDRIVASGGAIVSAFEPAEKAHPVAFHYRNGVLAALTDATVLVQAPIKSGARSMVARARRLARPLFVVPAAPWDEHAGGNVIEIARGANVLWNDAPLFAFFGVVPLRATPAAPVARLSPACEKVLDVVREAAVCLDDLCAGSGLPTPLVQEALLTLTLRAVLVEGPGGWYRRVRS
jgi:DNA processing protein